MPAADRTSRVAKGLYAFVRVAYDVCIVVPAYMNTQA